MAATLGSCLTPGLCTSGSKSVLHYVRVCSAPLQRGARADKHRGEARGGGRGGQVLPGHQLAGSTLPATGSSWLLFVTCLGLLFVCSSVENFNLYDIKFIFLSLTASGLYILTQKGLPRVKFFSIFFGHFRGFIFSRLNL